MIKKGGVLKRIPFAEIARHITGFSTPFFGISWQPPESEREVVRGLVTFLEDRRALYYPYQWETPQWVTESVLAMRSEITETLKNLPEGSEAVSSLKAMQAACRKFLDRTSRLVDRDPYPLHDAATAEPFFTALGQLRGVFGIHIAQLCVEFGIDLHSHLAEILPEASD